MKKGLFIIVCLCLSVVICAETASFTAEQQQFVDRLLPKIHITNQQVLSQRHRIENLMQTQEGGLSVDDRAWVVNVAAQYSAPDFDPDQLATWSALLARVDSIPASMALSQAMTESAWGTSRFAKAGNNYFGMHCYSEGCGIVPLNRPAGSRLEVKRYASLQASVNDYINNLNTGAAYQSLRDKRAALRAKSDIVSGAILVDGLAAYSELGEGYAEILVALIERYGLEQYDVEGAL